jgi:hypothetical protein
LGQRGAWVPSFCRFPALRAVKEHPDYQVVGELLEPVLDPRGNEENVAGPEALALGTIPEVTGASNHGIHFIPRMGRLGIVPPRSVELDTQSAVLEELDEPLTIGTGKSSQTLTNGELVSRHLPPAPS